MKKKLMTALALILVVAMSVAGTYAYLTSTKTVTNTFTVGSVGITLDEAKTNLDGEKVDKDGKVLETGDCRIPNDTDKATGNAYKLMPGHTYVKDPTVHVVANSENSWVFVKVVNGISAFESTDAGYTKIATQITDNGWTQLTYKDNDGNTKTVENVYYKEYEKSETVTNYTVFSQFKIADKADEVADWDKVGTDNFNSDVVITAYAIQKDGFTTAKAAWDEVSQQNPTTPAAPDADTPAEGGTTESGGASESAGE